MSRRRPVRKLLEKVRVARENHRERHQPSGFGFALADAVDYLNGEAWDRVTADASLFLRRDYLRIVEESGPEVLTPRYATVFRDQTPVAAVATQMVRLRGDQFVKTGQESAGDEKPASRGKRRRKALGAVKRRVLVCGNLLSWGQHGVAFAAGEDPAELWPAVAEALYRIRRADGLRGQTHYVMVKDLETQNAPGVDALARFSYRPVETEPDMQLAIRPTWNSLDDYLEHLTARYRRAARGILKQIDKAGCTVEHLDDLRPAEADLHTLYENVHQRAKVRMATIPSGYLPALGHWLGPGRFRCTVIRQQGRLVGFVTTLKDGDAAIGYYLGLDYDVNADAPIYHRLLYACIADAIDLRATRLSLGRTALEPKSRLGATPVPTTVWIRHRVPLVNFAVKQLLHFVPHVDAPERNPFKEA